MRPLYFLFGLLIGLCGGAVAYLVGADLIIQSTIDEVSLVAALLIAVAVGGFTSFFLARSYIIRKLDLEKNPSAASMVDKVFDLTESSGKLNYNQRLNASRDIVKSGIVWITSSMGYYSLINAVVAIVAIFAGTVASLLLYNQNELIEQQKKSDLLQAVLAESSRRALQFSFADPLISKLKEQKLEVGLSFKNLPGFRRTDAEQSDEIRTTLNRFQPYAIADFDPAKFAIDGDVSESVQVSFLSPEKGQILRSLFEQNVNVGVSLGPANFSYADYRNYLSLKEIRPLTCDDIRSSVSPTEQQFKNAFNRLDGSTDIRHADFSGSSLTQVWFQFQDGVKAKETKFESSVVELGIVPKQTFFMKHSILIIRTSQLLKDFNAYMWGGCIWILDDSGKINEQHPDVGKYEPHGRDSLLGLRLLKQQYELEGYYLLTR